MRSFRRTGISSLAFAIAVTSMTAGSNAQTTLPTAAPAPAVREKTPEQNARLAWWREAKFGMFIHWGLYAVPAGEWKGKPIAGIGEWIMNRAKIPVAEYEQLAGGFNPEKFDAEAWAQLAQDAGMKYLVITSKHHDGFAMFKSDASKYNIVDATPFKRDPMKELSAACAKRGIKFGFYYSQAQDWHEPGGAGNTWDFGPDDEKEKSGAFDKYLAEKVVPQVREICTGYGDLGLIWFDTPRLMNAERAQRLETLVHQLQPNCLVSGRIGPGSHSDYDSEGDNHIPGTIRPGDWETPATLNNTWGFKKDDENWKKPEDLTFKLVDIVSKGGNYLLNVGPTAEGVIPQPSQDMLRTMGKWVHANGEAIYGAGPTAFGDEFGKPTGKKDNRNRDIFDAKTDWRCTTKPGKLYFTVFKWPADGKLTFPHTAATKAYLLADNSKELKIQQADTTTTIELPARPDEAIASVIVLETAK